MGKSWFTIKQLLPGIFGIAEFGHFEKAISYLFVGLKEALLFDTGMGIGNIRKEVERTTRLPITVINSHCHFDHIGGNHLFNNIYYFEDPWCKSRHSVGYSHKDIKEYVSTETFYQEAPKGFVLNKYSILPYAISHTLKDDDCIEIDPYTFSVIHTPGHTPDSICLYEKRNHILLTGDTIYPGPIYLQIEESDFQAYRKSITKLLSWNKVQLILPGHNRTTYDARIIVRIFRIIEPMFDFGKSYPDIRIDRYTTIKLT